VPDPGVPERPDGGFESDGIQVRGVVVSTATTGPSHHACRSDLGAWLRRSGVPGLEGVDTRALIRRLREHGTMPGRLVGRRPRIAGPDEMVDPLDADLVRGVSCGDPRTYGSGKRRIALVDCGCKRSIIASLVDQDVEVTVVPWDTPADRLSRGYHAVVLSNGPGDPERCEPTIETARALMDRRIPIFGICLGHQIMALAAGATTYKLPYGHRGQNQPCVDLQTGRCSVTSQNHGFAVREDSIPEGWQVWFRNLNDDTVEGIRCETGPFRAVQFHPEARPGPVDTLHLVEDFVRSL